MAIQIGIDIGGTKIAVAAFSADGDVRASCRAPTPKTYEALLEQCFSLFASVVREAGDVAQAGLCLPGVIDRKLGTVASGNLSFLKEKPFGHDLERLLKRPLAIGNDANCAALAEALAGAGKGYESVLGLCLSTGIGSGFVLHGRIWEGANGLAGEVGHLPLAFREPQDGPPSLCSCGQLGCVEDAISGGGFKRLYSFITGDEAPEPEMIVQHCLAGDKKAAEVIDRYLELVAKAMVGVFHSLDPSVVVVSGGLMNIPGLFEEVPRRLLRYICAEEIRTPFVPARFDTLASAFGASLLPEMMEREKIDDV
ncbi:MAG: ROK family protein [Alphaproteobacteria bacterium]|nr:ROK family protein [Alphaproteobacteria bacterium]